MKSYGLNELRKMYLEFFESKGHLRADSFSLVPNNDKSLLLINSGMAPLKPYFTGQEIPPNKRMTTCQKCIRTGDIENVGKTSRHGTFFEMLGNFSFGDYFKKEAIAWAWEFFTVVLEVPKDQLHISVYLEDDEAEQIWHEQEGVAMDHLYRLGKEDNFWEHGAGPCGPCSEIHIDRGEAYGCDSPTCAPGCDCDRYVEVWNLVFTQFEATPEGEYIPLEFPNIDTGMGLERLAVMMQGVDSIFDVDTIKTLLDEVCSLAGVSYQTDAQTDVSIRLVTDHIRSVTFMTADGILPSNEGRGYVLRRLLRRAARHGKLLGIEGDFLAKLVAVVIETSKEAYPELAEKEAYIYKIISIEEERFAETIDYGLSILNGHIETLEADGGQELDGDTAFMLYDTYGFPFDLTLEILEEKGMTVDEEAFKVAMNEQRTRARAARGESNYMGAEETVYNQLNPDMTTEFVGYKQLTTKSTVVALTTETDLVELAQAGDDVTVFVNATPFYATSGGQQADIGRIVTDSGIVRVRDVKKLIGNKFAHIGRVESGEVKVGAEVELIVDGSNRRSIMRNHSATHLLQKALKNVLGDHIEQAGSSVTSERLRFDFTHFTAMTAEEVQLVEAEVNAMVSDELAISVEELPIAEAKKKGAMALFGEKYGEVVRVVSMGAYSVELCGGTHLSNTVEVGTFKIVGESGVAAGVRRIEALTGAHAIDFYKAKEAIVAEVASKVRADESSVLNKIDTILEENKVLKQELDQIKAKLASSAADDLINQAKKIGDIDFLAADVKGVDAGSLRDMGDKFKSNLSNGVVVLATESKGKVNLIVMASDEAVKMGAHAGNIIREAAKVVGGGGGGRPNMAQAGGKDPSKIAEALIKAEEVLNSQIS